MLDRLRYDAAIDLQMHTTFSDGVWSPTDLLDHAKREGFSLIAITDHERVDTVAALQQLADAKHMPVLTAAEMSTSWHGELTDVLCFGFAVEPNALQALANAVIRRQSANTRAICHSLRQQDLLALTDEEITALVALPSTKQPDEMIVLLTQRGQMPLDTTPGMLLKAAGFQWATNDLAAVVAATHQSGGVCLIAHPGRGNGYTCYDAALLDTLRADIPIDGFEAYYPLHTPEQTAQYVAYAQEHRLLISAGSDSHGPQKPPIKYRAEQVQALLERLGIAVES